MKSNRSLPSRACSLFPSSRFSKNSFLFQRLNNFQTLVGAQWRQRCNRVGVSAVTFLQQWRPFPPAVLASRRNKAQQYDSTSIGGGDRMKWMQERWYTKISNNRIMKNSSDSCKRKNTIAVLRAQEGGRLGLEWASINWYRGGWNGDGKRGGFERVNCKVKRLRKRLRLHHSRYTSRRHHRHRGRVLVPLWKRVARIRQYLINNIFTINSGSLNTQIWHLPIILQIPLPIIFLHQY